MEKFDYIQNKQHLIDVYQETVNAVLNGKYTAPDGTVIELGSDREMRENSGSIQDGSPCVTFPHTRSRQRWSCWLQTASLPESSCSMRVTTLSC